MLFLCHTNSDRAALEDNYPFAGVWLTPSLITELIRHIEEMQGETCIEKIYTTKAKLVFFGTRDDRPAMILSYAGQDYVLVDPTFPKEVEFDEAPIKTCQIYVTIDGVAFSAVDVATGCTFFTQSYLAKKTLKDILDDTTITR